MIFAYESHDPVLFSPSLITLEGKYCLSILTS